MEERLQGGNKRLATLVGCNYVNTRYELHGCINDVLAMNELLLSRFGFKAGDIEMLTDAPDSPIMPTGVNIRRALSRMINSAEPGDVLFFHYSGHGTLIPPVKSHHHGRSRPDEAIIPCDFNLITDVDLRQLIDGMPSGASLTIVSDSCHSGGLIDKEKEQIGPSTWVHGSISFHRQKFIPFESVLAHLTSLSTIDSPNIADHLLNLFGGQLSATFSDHNFTKDHTECDAGILLSGCQSDETSADMSPEGGLNKAYGAFSNSIQMVLKDHKGPISNRDLVTRSRRVLCDQGFMQHPCLYCSDENVDVPFLWQPGAAMLEHGDDDKSDE